MYHTHTCTHTILQVDDLKEKLKAQEVELKQKNEDADALIKRVAVEQEKVGKEKAFADEEEKKVAKINDEVSKKQRDCETDLAKAEPALKVSVFIIHCYKYVFLLNIFCCAGYMYMYSHTL